MRWFKASVGLLLIAVLAAGCIRVEGTIVINDDGSGEVNFISALDADGVLDILGDSDEIPAGALGSADDLCADADIGDIATAEDLPSNAVVSDYDEDGFCGTQITLQLLPSTDHSASIAGLFEGGGTRLFQQGENWIFETSLPPTEDAVSDTDGIPPGIVDALFDGASVKFIVDLPGRAIDGQNNATSVGSDGRFEWDIDFLDPPDRLFAQTEPGSGGGDGGGGGLGLILIIVAIVLLAAAAAWWFLTQRNKGSGGPSTPPLGAAGATPPPSASPPPAGGPQPAVADQAVKPSNPQAQATVAMPAAGSTPATPEPVWDAALNAWVIDDPVQGKLVHDAATDSWRPA